jgi:hypothetical protein
MPRDFIPDAEMIRFARANAEAVMGSGVFVVMFNPAMIDEVAPLLRLGLAVYMDKPIYLLIPESVALKVPDNLKRLARGYHVYRDGDREDMEKAMFRLIGDMQDQEG